MRRRAAPPIDARSIGRLQLPVLVVHGEHDVEQRKAAAEWLLSVAAAGRGCAVAQAGHLPNLDNPREYEERCGNSCDAHRVSPPDRPETT